MSCDSRTIGVFMSKFYLVNVLFLICCSCKQSNSGPGSKEPVERPTTDTITYQIPSKVSAFTLDDKKFSINQIAIGLQTYVKSQTPVVSYKVPEGADYVEILRCRNDAVLTTGSDPINLVDIELSGRSDAEKAHLYRSNDYFKAGEDNLQCELLTQGYVGKEFFDAFAPSGSFRYMIRACVTPSRLIDQEGFSRRNCSRRVGFSALLADYKNSRQKKEQDSLRLASIYASKMGTSTATMKFLAEGANAAINECEEREHQRLVEKKVRDAWITIAASVIETSFEITTLRSTNKGLYGKLTKASKAKGKVSFLDVAQLIGATQGATLSETFIQIAGSSHDMPRSCATYKKIIDNYLIMEEALGQYSFKYLYYMEIAEIAQLNNLAVGGEEVDIPQVDDPRLFNTDTEIPEIDLPSDSENSNNESQTP